MLSTIDSLCAAIERDAPAEQADRVRELVRGVLELHAAVLARVLELAGEGDPALRDRLAADELVGAVLGLHDLHPWPAARRIGDALVAQADGLARHGVHVEGVDVDAGRARVRVIGQVAPGAEAEIASIALAAAPEVEAIEVVGSKATLVPVERLRVRRAP